MKTTVIIVGMIYLLMISCESHQKSKIEVVKIIETTLSWNGDILPEYRQGTPKITMLRITIPPNKKLEIHKHLVVNAGILLKGTLRVVSEKNDTLYQKIPMKSRKFYTGQVVMTVPYIYSVADIQ